LLTFPSTGSENFELADSRAEQFRELTQSTDAAPAGHISLAPLISLNDKGTLEGPEFGLTLTFLFAITLSSSYATFGEMGAFVYITACSLVGFLSVLFFMPVLRSLVKTLVFQ